MLTLVPVMKVLTEIVSCAWWTTCVQWGACSFWLGIITVNVELLFETVFFAAFVVLGKGWCVTRLDLTRDEWRSLMISLCGFYLFDSLLLVFKEYIGFMFWLLTSILYFTLMYYAVKGELNNLLSPLKTQHSITPKQPINTSILYYSTTPLLHLYYTTTASLLLLHLYYTSPTL